MVRSSPTISPIYGTLIPPKLEMRTNTEENAGALKCRGVISALSNV